MTIKEVITAKLTSGKFIFTIISGIVFAVMSITGKLPPDKTYEIIVLVVYAYFSRKSDAKADNGANK